MRHRLPGRSATLLLSALALVPTTYVVRPGDSVTGIASRFGTTVAALTRNNHLGDPDAIVAGSRLIVPPPAASAPTSSLPRPPVFIPPAVQIAASPARRALVPSFRRWAAANRIPVDLVEATTWMESGWQNGVVSPTGAVGIGQLEPDTTRFVREVLIGQTTLDPRKPEDNIRLSTRYLAWLLQRYHGDAPKALAAYYQGPGSVDKHGASAETKAYVANVLALQSMFRT